MLLTPHIAPIPVPTHRSVHAPSSCRGRSPAVCPAGHRPGSRRTAPPQPPPPLRRALRARGTRSGCAATTPRWRRPAAGCRCRRPRPRLLGGAARRRPRDPSRELSARLGCCVVCCSCGQNKTAGSRSESERESAAAALLRVKQRLVLRSAVVMRLCCAKNKSMIRVPVCVGVGIGGRGGLWLARPASRSFCSARSSSSAAPARRCTPNFATTLVPACRAMLDEVSSLLRRSQLQNRPPSKRARLIETAAAGRPALQNIDRAP